MYAKNEKDDTYFQLVHSCTANYPVSRGFYNVPQSNHALDQLSNNLDRIDKNQLNYS